MNEFEKAYELCLNKIIHNIEKMPLVLKEYPGVADGNYFDAAPEKCKKFLHIMNWTTSFFTGMALVAFETCGDTSLLKWVNSQYDLYYKKVFEYPQETMHDLGFLYSPYSVFLYKLTGDINNRKVALKAADELAKRYVVNGRYIRAWGRMDDIINEPDTELAKDHFYTKSRGLAIIDCMMNLPLLFWASSETGNSFYKDIASAHADTTLQYFIREDYSVYHSYRFDHKTGEPVGGRNFCGYADESHWARGTTWAIYGFAIAYGYTGKQEYLNAARNISYKFIEELDEKVVPVWDFRLSEGMPKNRDASAAAIAVCGFMEILKHQPGDLFLKEWSEKLLEKLTEEAYTDYDVEIPGILKQCNGNMTYTSYGDYFYMEALARKLYGIETCW